ncbi:hypothetical protein DdX_15452 [Ditylenchus destructor]|uniref:Uncharacterized protein n=1 Tax=Ditylenchus destructor TaxID=166010 RepID=A0AAD4MRC1_9BILA|nr:hypothetical protein DdX_15452 [Ditylenchus destructor]
MPQWDATPMTDKDTSAINHTVDEILEGQELLLGVISVNPQLAPSPQLVAYDAAGNLFINGGYEQGSVTALLPEAFQIPLQFTKANALLNVAVCVRANSKCIRGGLTLSIGDCNMTVPADSLKPLKESECWIGGWAVKNTRLGDGMVIKYDVPTCRMVAVITSKDIRKCEMDWEPFKIIASDSRVDEKDAMPHEETLEYEQTKSYEEVWSSSNTQEQEDGGKREEEDGQQSGRVDTVGSKETTYEEVTDSEKTNVQWNKENAAPMQMPGLAGAFMSPAQGFLNKMTDGLPPCVKDITNVKNAMNGQDQAIAAQAGVAVSHRGGVVNRAAGATLTALIPLITAGLDFMGKSAGKKDNGDSKGPSNTCGVETLHSQKWGSVDEHKQEVTTTDLQSHKSLRMKYYKSRYTNTQSHAIKYTETAKKIMKTNITVKPGVTYEARQLYIKCGGDAQKWKSPHIRILQYYTDGRRPNETYDNYQNSDLFKGTCVVKNDTCKPVNATDSMSSYNTTDSDISTTDPDKNGEPSIGVAYDWQALISVVVLLLVASHGYV